MTELFTFSVTGNTLMASLSSTLEQYLHDFTDNLMLNWESASAGRVKVKLCNVTEPKQLLSLGKWAVEYRDMNNENYLPVR